MLLEILLNLDQFLFGVKQVLKYLNAVLEVLLELCVVSELFFNLLQTVHMGTSVHQKLSVLTVVQIYARLAVHKRRLALLKSTNVLLH